MVTREAVATGGAGVAVCARVEGAVAAGCSQEMNKAHNSIGRHSRGRGGNHTLPMVSQGSRVKCHNHITARHSYH